MQRVSEFTSRIEDKMARAAAGFRFNKRWIIGRERASGGVESINKKLVDSEIGDHREPVVGRNVDRMRVGLRLKGRVAPMPDVLHECSLLPQSTVFLDA